MRLGLGVGVPMPAGVGVVSGFSPLDLSPVLWLDASDTSTITEVAGSVSQWDDKSGNGYHVTQGTAANQPTSGTATINGLNVIEYDGADTQYMANASMPWNGVSLTVFAVYEINPSDLIIACASANSSLSYLYIGFDGNGSTTLSLAMSGTSLYVDGVQFTGTTRGDVYTAVGNSPVIIRATGTSTTYNGISVGYPVPNAMFSHGTKVAEMIVVASPTAGQIAATEAYLAAKWNVSI